MRPLAILSLAAVVTLGVSACGSATSAPEAGSAASSAGAGAEPTAAASATPATTDAGSAPAAGATAPGAYLTKAEYQEQAAAREGTTVVYFFHADWCPSCRATEAAIAADGVPDGLTVVKVDFDSETDLRKEYGITQ
jgi:thiol-disulfide isomerase/thioredoxin